MLAALAQPRRLEAFRELVRAGPGGLAAGALAARLATPPSTLSTHLRMLETAGLVRSRRAGRHIFYAVSFEATRAFFSFLLEDCCGGRPEICAHLRPACPQTEAAA